MAGKTRPGAITGGAYEVYPAMRIAYGLGLEVVYQDVDKPLQDDFTNRNLNDISAAPESRGFSIRPIGITFAPPDSDLPML